MLGSVIVNVKIRQVEKLCIIFRIVIFNGLFSFYLPSGCVLLFFPILNPEPYGSLSTSFVELAAEFETLDDTVFPTPLGVFMCPLTILIGVELVDKSGIVEGLSEKKPRIIRSIPVFEDS